MAQTDLYQLLGVSSKATAEEIKLAYRKKAKQFHPDRQSAQEADGKAVVAAHEAIVELNAAYEVLGDPERRKDYDKQSTWGGQYSRSGAAPYQSYADYARASGVDPTPEAGPSQSYRRRSRGRATDVALEDWMRQIYNPVSRYINLVVKPLNTQIRELSADPFDDELMDVFVAYLEDCRTAQEKADNKFKSMPNPPIAAGPASKLYYAINHLGDGIEELERFTTSYEESYIHSGKELFRRAKQFRKEAQESLKRMGR